MVTGAAGGIGSATALRLAREGGQLILLDRKLELLQGAAAAVSETGTVADCHAVDQTDAAAVSRCVEEVVATHGGIDLLFANAGYGQMASFLETTAKQWHRHVDVNLTGTFQVCQTVARAMVARKAGGAIVLNASSGAVMHADHLSAYCTTKAAVRMLAIGMASELGAHRIRVNSVMPGVIETGMTAPMLDDEQVRGAILANTTVGRLGRPEDVAALVAYLGSDEAGFVNGESVAIDGGQMLHGHPRWMQTDYRNEYEDRWEPGT